MCLPLVACWAMVRPGAWFSSLCVASNTVDQSINPAIIITIIVYLRKELFFSAGFIVDSHGFKHL
jgi:hypothetical protein